MRTQDWTFDADGNVVSSAWLATVLAKGLKRCTACDDWTTSPDAAGECPACQQVNPVVNLTMLGALAMVGAVGIEQSMVDEATAAEITADWFA